MIGNHKRLNQGLWFNLMRRGEFKAEFEANHAAARALVEVFEPRLAGRMFEPIAGLPMIDRRRIEICRALISEPKLLLLDEPSAGMTHDETKELFDDILQVRDRHRNLTIVIVEHEMGVIERITDRCVVLNFGRKIAEGPYRQVAADRQVQEAYLGLRRDDRPAGHRERHHGLRQGRRPGRRLAEDRAGAPSLACLGPTAPARPR